MIVLGAARHAKEVLQIMTENDIKVDFLFDDFSSSFDSYFKNYNILKSVQDPIIKKNDTFALGLGGTNNRKILFDKFINLGLSPLTITSNTSIIGSNCVCLGRALNIMHFAFISDNVKIGDGSLINAYASVHHDVLIGDFSEISPKAILLGGVSVGSFTSIGAGSVILPNVKVGNNCIIGAGSIVTKNIDDNEVWYGNPAKFINRNQ